MNTVILISAFVLIIAAFIGIAIKGWNNMQNNSGKSTF